MEELKNKFWTDKNEMVEELKELGYDVLELNDEYITIEDEDEEQTTLNLIIAGSTITIVVE